MLEFKKHLISFFYSSENSLAFFFRYVLFHLENSAKLLDMMLSGCLKWSSLFSEVTDKTFFLYCHIRLEEINQTQVCNKSAGMRFP